MLIKVIIVIWLFAIIYCLGSGLYFLLQKKPENDQQTQTGMARALTWRIALSFGLFLLLVVAYLCGWIHPHRAF